MVFTHLTIWCISALRGRPRRAGIRWFAVVGLVVYLAQFTLGNLIYPTFKVRVWIAYLSREPDLGWARHLFEKKEHVAAIALPAVILVAVLAFRPATDRGSLRMLAVAAALVAACAWFAALAGLLVTSVRAIGG
jgi:hypothetical protein